MSLPQPVKNQTHVIEIPDRAFPQVPLHSSYGQQAQTGAHGAQQSAIVSPTQINLGTTASETSQKRKRDPRPKLDNKKCARCRNDKVKCLPQPRAWPARCQRCSIKGFECSPREVKRRARRKASPPSLSSPGSESTHQDDHVSDIRDQIRQVSAEPHVENVQASWDYTDLINMVTYVQLLRYQGSFLAAMASRLEKLTPEPGRPMRDNAWVEAGAIDQYLPQLTKDIQKIVRARQHSGSLIMNDRILYENAYEAVDEDFVVPKHDPISEELPVGIQIRHLVRRLRLDIRRKGSCDFRLLDKLVGQLADEAPAWQGRFGLPDYNGRGVIPFGLSQTVKSAVFGLVVSPEFLVQPWILDWVLRYILESRDRMFPIPITRFAEVWNADEGSDDLSTLATGDKGDFTNPSLLHVAVLCNKPRIVRTLIKDSPSPNYQLILRGFSMFHYSASLGSVDCYRELLQCKNAQKIEGMEASNGDLPLHVAARKGHEQMVNYILSVHSDKQNFVNQGNLLGETPLIQAVQYGVYSIVQLLLDYPGVDIAAFDHKGKTALEHTEENENIFRLILSKLPDQYFNTLNGLHNTPLHRLARHAGQKLMHLVLSLPSILPDKEDKSGETPLCYALFSENLEAVKALGIRRDVDVTKLSKFAPKHTGYRSYIQLAKAHGRYGPNRFSQILDWLKIHCKELEAELTNWEIRN